MRKGKRKPPYVWVAEYQDMHDSWWPVMTSPLFQAKAIGLVVLPKIAAQAPQVKHRVARYGRASK